ncbi:DUF4238 domain-containing protein [Escherichia coli]|nr:DUF4238 domain-containing protein [Escherichia coli]
MNKARNHHYLSQCYLRGFTKNGGVKSNIIAFDLKKKTTFEAKPRNVGGIRDFNRIDIEGVDQNILESTLANFEGNVATELKNLKQGMPFSGQTKDIILSFISLLAVRTPAMRDHMESQIVKMVDMVAKMTASDEDRYNDTIREAAFTVDVSFEKIKNFIGGSQYSISVKREFLIAAEMKISRAIDNALHCRDWRLFRSTEESGTFITSDNPVGLMWTDESDGSPGFLVENTCVLFPISKDIILFGDYGGRTGEHYANKNIASHFNAFVISNAVERVFSADRTFNYINVDGVIKQGNNLV